MNAIIKKTEHEHLLSVSDIERMAIAVAKSGLFGIKTPDQAMALMLIAQAEGLHPAIAARDYNVIDGKPALKADAMLARFIAGGGKVQWHEHTDQCVSATFSHPSGGSVKIDWDMARAKQAGIGGKQNWQKYPRQMLRARVISEGVRAVNPNANSGLYTPEEVMDFTPSRDMGEVDRVEEVPEPITDQQAADLIALLEEVNANKEAFCSYFKIGAVAELPAKCYKQAVAMIEAKRSKVAT
jgi:hypothetical protein